MDLTFASKRAECEGASVAAQAETIGRFATGIAHDFNNLLGVILASSEGRPIRPSKTAPASAT